MQLFIQYIHLSIYLFIASCPELGFFFQLLFCSSADSGCMIIYFCFLLSFYLLIYLIYLIKISRLQTRALRCTIWLPQLRGNSVFIINFWLSCLFRCCYSCLILCLTSRPFLLVPLSVSIILLYLCDLTPYVANQLVCLLLPFCTSFVNLFQTFLAGGYHSSLTLLPGS